MREVEQMTSKDYHYRHSCRGKAGHADPVHALMACSIAFQRYADPSLFVYKCDFCPNYHTGHVQRQVRQFICDLLDIAFSPGHRMRRLGFSMGNKLKEALCG